MRTDDEEIRALLADYRKRTGHSFSEDHFPVEARRYNRATAIITWIQVFAFTAVVLLVISVGVAAWEWITSGIESVVCR